MSKPNSLQMSTCAPTKGVMNFIFPLCLPVNIVSLAGDAAALPLLGQAGRPAQIPA